MLDRILGLIRPRAHAVAEPRPALPPVQVITGGAAAPELAMLCRDASHDVIASMDAMRVVQLKADGLRAIYIDGRIVSREGVPMGCALHCQPALRRIEQAMGCAMVFDCEYVADGGYAATVSEHKRGEGAGVLWIFDALPLADWLKGGSDVGCMNRLMALREAIGAAESPFVGMLNYWLLNGQETIAKAAELWAYGYEGVVTKRWDSPYVRERSNDWLRLKQTFTADLPVVDSVFKDGALKTVIVRGPEGIGPIRLGKGWTAEEASNLDRVFNGSAYLKGEAVQQNVFDQLARVRAKVAGGDTPMKAPLARVSYQLSTGDKRTVLGAVFHSLV